MTPRTIACAVPGLALVLLVACGPRDPITELAAAARAGDLAAIDRLVAAGADLNQPSGTNAWPPVLHAIHKGQHQALTRLIDRGASIGGDVGRRALFMASGYGDADSVAVLLARGAPMPQSVTAAGELIAAAIGGAWDIDYTWSGCARHTAVAKLLIAQDSDLRVVGILSPTSFARATSTFHYRLARWYARRKGCDELLRIVGKGEA